MKDLHGRTINYLRISLTENCNLRCTYFKPEECISPQNDGMTKEEIVSIIQAMAEAGIKKVRFTGGEPLLRKDIDEIISATASIPGIDDIALTTNGILLEKKAKELELGNYLLFGIGEKKQNGKKNPTNLANALEALIGAVYLDSDLETVKKFIFGNVFETVSEF